VTVKDGAMQATESDDVILLLRSQHEQVKALMASIATADTASRQEKFDQLRAFLAMHETAEEMIVRPVSRQVAGAEVVDARNAEEKQATEVLAELEELDATSPEFLPRFEAFRSAVLLHAQNEESLEFPRILSDRSPEERAQMGRALRAAEKLAPTHPHPSTAGSAAAQYVVGPFAAMVDKVRDALSRG
jgi:hemerythrin superfamily protein